MSIKPIVCFVILFTLTSAYAQEPQIIPKPVKCQSGTGNFVINKNTVLVVPESAGIKSARFFNDYLSRFYGFRLNQGKQPHSNFILLYSKPTGKSQKGGYELQISPNSVKINGDSGEGIFYGIQTLIQLLPTGVSAELKIPVLLVEDYPRFSYRGLMLDCGRHFFPVDFIKKYIDFIALHKMNYFHWHLTEDQGWRIEIKKYPLLTQVGGCRNGTIIGHHPGTGNDNTRYCGYYTQDEIREIVRYAADRYITIIPEIEMPGHSSAAIAAYPKLSCFPEEHTSVSRGVKWNGDSTGKQVQQSWGVYRDVYCPSEYTFSFLQDVLDEVMELFPSKYIHIGGDECPKDNWKRSSFCQELIRTKGLKNEEGLQSYFIQRIEKYLNAKGRVIIGWDEILEGGVAPNAAVMSWRGEAGGNQAAKLRHQVVMTPNHRCYFDHAQNKNEDSLTIGGYLPLDTVYAYEPIPLNLPSAGREYILGAQANVWTEYMSSPEKVEYMIFPRLSAISEVLWSPGKDKNYEDFLVRLKTQYLRYDLWKTAYHPIEKLD